MQNISEMVKVTAGIVAQAVVDKTLREQKKPEFIHGIPALARFLNVSVSTAERYRRRGLVPARKLGRKVFFETSEVLKAMEGRKDA